MDRSSGSLGSLFIHTSLEEQVWRKARFSIFTGPAEYATDDYGKLLRRQDYGDRSSRYGWEIDHIVPKALGGTDDLSNLRPLHCSSNASLGGILGGFLRD
ncbi:HNH endonuclease signature motif containing protein [Stappia indica]|uniref:HNH endonuclease n=1 Tax=Stappia indica TaxID=538381 RepID=UPI0009F42BF5